MDIVFAILFFLAVVALVFVGYKWQVDEKDIQKANFIIGGLLYINSKLDYPNQDIVKSSLSYMYMAAGLVSIGEFDSPAQFKGLIISKTEFICEKEGIECIDFSEPFVDLALDFIIQELFN